MINALQNTDKWHQIWISQIQVFIFKNLKLVQLEKYKLGQAPAMFCSITVAME